MLAILYLLLCAAFGMCFVGLSVPDVRRLYVACSPSAKAITHIPNTLFTVPAGIVTGMLCVPFFNYYVTLGLSSIPSSTVSLSLASPSLPHSLCSTHTGSTEPLS